MNTFANKFKEFSNTHLYELMNTNTTIVSSKPPPLGPGSDVTVNDLPPPLVLINMEIT